MARIPRVTHKVFGSSAAAGVNGVAQPGSKQQGSPVYTTDISVIQALAAWLNGLSGVVVSGKVLPLEELNALFLEPSQQIGEILQDGIPPYDAGTTYFTNSVCSYLGQIYISLTDTNIGNTPSTSGTSWTNLLGRGAKGLNIIRNGSMSVAQRGTSGQVGTGTPVYTLDGWIVDSVGANCNWSQLVNASNSLLALALFPLGTLTDLYIKQRIESILMSEIGYTNITIQANIFNGTTSPLVPNLILNIPTATDNYSSITNVLAATNLQSIAAGASGVVAYTFKIDNTVNYNNGLEIIFDFGNQVQNSKNVRLSAVDVSPTPLTPTGLNSNPPSPTIRQISDDELFCQRYANAYLFNQVGSGSFPLVLGFGSGSTAVNYFFQFPATMRMPPALSIANPNDFGLQGMSGIPIDTTALAFQSSSQVDPKGAVVQATVSSGAALNTPYYLVSVTGNNRIIFSSEL